MLSKVVSDTDADDARGPASNSPVEGFFSIEDKEAFSNDAETLAEQGKLISPDKNS